MNLQIAMYVCTGINLSVCIVYIYLYIRQKKRIKGLKKINEEINKTRDENLRLYEKFKNIRNEKK